MWLIEGLEDDRFALITKTHHSLIDGIAGVDLATVLFDLSREPPPIKHSGRAVAAAPRAGHGRARRRGRARRGARRRSSSPRARSTRSRTPSARSPARAKAPRAIGEIVWAGLNPAPETPLNVHDRPAPALPRHRRLARGLQDRQERLRRHRQRRRARGRRRRAAHLPDLPRPAHRGRRDARAGAGVGAHRGRARPGAATASS